MATHRFTVLPFPISVSSGGVDTPPKSHSPASTLYHAQAATVPLPDEEKVCGIGKPEVTGPRFLANRWQRDEATCRLSQNSPAKTKTGLRKLCQKTTRSLPFVSPSRSDLGVTTQEIICILVSTGKLRGSGWLAELGIQGRSLRGPFYELLVRSSSRWKE